MSVSVALIADVFNVFYQPAASLYGQEQYFMNFGIEQDVTENCCIRNKKEGTKSYQRISCETCLSSESKKALF